MLDELKLRVCTPDDLIPAAELVTGALLVEMDEEVLEARRMVFEPERTHVVADGDRLVGAAGVFTRAMTVPGGSIPVAHVTGVGVAATHRRRGLLTALMTEQMQAIRDRGEEPIAALWASEGTIYGRFGYGLASWNVAYEVATRETSVPGVTPPGRLREVSPRDSRDVLAVVHEQASISRPGLSSRPGRWWERRTTDVRARRGGMSAERAVVYEDDGRVEGYAMWRTKGGWGPGGPVGEALVTEVVATTGDAYAALWRFLLSLDLVRTVRCGHAAVDEPLPHLVSNPSALVRTMTPGLWVRVIDVPAALSARRYCAAVDVVAEITDAAVPDNAGRWRLVGDRDSAVCTATSAEPDLTMDVRDLGAAYLGGVSVRSLADAGRITEHRPGAVAAVSAAFGWDRAPLASEIF